MLLGGSRSVTIEDLIRVAREKEMLELDTACLADCEEARKSLLQRQEKETIYGVNTGFGALAQESIPAESRRRAQLNLVRSHSSGVGDPFPEEVVRGAMFLLANELLKNYSGVRRILIEKIVEFINKGITPWVPSYGSVGASGDLAPLAHVALALIGEGDVTLNGKRRRSRDLIEPLMLEEKEGLSLINGTHFMTSVAALALHDSYLLLRSAVMASSLTLEATMSTDTFLDEKLNSLRRQEGQIKTAREMRSLVEDSEIIAYHKSCGKVQDPYSIRCSPQVLGACLDLCDFSKQQVEREMNAVTDNPIIINGKAILGGNFHGAPVAQALDCISIALATISTSSERRIAQLLNSRGLPQFLTGGEEGLNSGMMIAQYTAASLTSENKLLAHPASVDSIPTSGLQEDHVSMGMNSALKALRSLRNSRYVVAIELLCGAQALEIRMNSVGKRGGRGTMRAHELVRKLVPFLGEDRPLYNDIETLANSLCQITQEVYDGSKKGHSE